MGFSSILFFSLVVYKVDLMTEVKNDKLCIDSIKMWVPPNLICRLNAIPIKIAKLFSGHWQSDSKRKWSKIAKTTLKDKNQF